MRINIILGHPEKNSFNHAIAEICCQQLLNNGHSVFYHDLYSENFNPVHQINSNFITTDGAEVIEKHIADLKCSDGIIVIHPNWWGQPPAIVKGWVDRVFIPDVAYGFETNASGKNIPCGLLVANAALVFNTSNTPDEIEKSLYNDPLETLWGKRVFGFCGVKQFERKNFNVMKDSNEAMRNKWLAQVKLTINKYFPKE